MNTYKHIHTYICIYSHVYTPDTHTHTHTHKHKHKHKHTHTHAHAHAHAHAHTHMACLRVATIHRLVDIHANDSRSGLRDTPTRARHRRWCRRALGRAASNTDRAPPPWWRTPGPKAAHTCAMYVTAAVFHLLMSALKAVEPLNACKPTNSTVDGGAECSQAVRTRAPIQTHTHTRMQCCAHMWCTDRDICLC